MARDGFEVGLSEQAVALLELAVVAEREEEGKGLGGKLALEFVERSLMVLFDSVLEVGHALIARILLLPHQRGEERGLAALGGDDDELGAVMRLGGEVPACVEGHGFQIGAEDDVGVPAADFFGDDAHHGAPVQFFEDRSRLEVRALSGVLECEEDGLFGKQFLVVEEVADVLESDGVVACADQGHEVGAECIGGDVAS